ncbi:hypothetical protein ACHAWF_005952 [Thalassiosira exigua]
MWQAMTPHLAIPPNAQQSAAAAGKTRTNSVPNPDGSSTIYVHHISHGAAPAPAPAQAAPMMGMPYPMAMPMQVPPQPAYNPYPMYPPPPPPYGPYGPYGGHHHHQPHQPHQPAVVVIQDKPEEKPKEEKKKDDKPKEEKKKDAKKDAKKEEKKKEEKKEEKKPEPSGPQDFSKFGSASLIVFALGLVFGIASTFKAYEALDLHEAGLTIEDERYEMARTVTVATAAAATLCMVISTLCSFYAGLNYQSRSKSKKRPHCCLGGLIIAGWIIFALTFVTDLVILVLAFDDDSPIYPEIIWTAMIGAILAWMLMFGYSELARRS